MKSNVFCLQDADFTRTAVIGCPGSGKTTFSNNLQEILHRRAIHLDKVLWAANWKMLDYEKRVEIHNNIICQDSWLIDGMWKSHLPDRFKRATLVIFLDFRRSLCLYRAVKRRVRYSGKQREDIADACLEKLDGYFLKYIWTFRKKVRPVILSLMEENPQIKVIRLTSPKEAQRFLQQLSQLDR